MFNDYLGATLNLSQLAHAESVYELRFLNDEAAELDVSNVTFTGWVADASGATHELSAWHVDSVPGGVGVRFPDLAEGAYKWEVMATDESGNSTRLVSGRLQVLRTILQLTSDTSYAYRTLNVRMPSLQGERLLLQWNAATAAEMAAQKAAAYCAKAEQVLKDVLAAAGGAEDAVSKALAELNALKKAAEDAANDAATALGKLDGLDSLLEEFTRALSSQIHIDPVTNYWMVAGVCSYIRATGESGKSPKLSSSYTWLVYNDETKQWKDTGVSAVGQDGHSPYISALGTWIEWRNGAWRDTGCNARGKDGIDGDATRRILVQSVDDIPNEGETCTGGVLYYVPVPDEQPRAVITPQAEGRTASDALTVDGVDVPLSGLDELEPIACAAALWQAIEAANVPGVTGYAEGEQVHLSTTNRTLTVSEPDDGYNVLEIPYLEGEGYLVHAWLEQADGTAGWHCVGTRNDIATSEVYGLVRIATDLPVNDGAPVGNSRARQLSVPLAAHLLAGAVKRALSDFISLEDGGAVTTDEHGHMVAQTANAQRWGVMKHSTGRTAGADCIALLPDGSTGATWADLTHGGVMKPGSEMKQLNEIPYQQAVGLDSDHCLCNNFLNEGAIKHMRPAGWIQAMPWVRELPAGTFDADSYYTGLHTSLQFGQNRANGLTLASASATLLAGVYLADGRDDTRDNAVLTATQTATYYYNKDEVYTKRETYSKEEVYSKLQSYHKTETYTRAEVESLIAQAVAQMKSWVSSENYVPFSIYNEDKQHYVYRTGSVSEIHTLTKEEFENLENLKNTGLYLN